MSLLMLIARLLCAPPQKAQQSAINVWEMQYHSSNLNFLASKHYRTCAKNLEKQMFYKWFRHHILYN